MIVYVVTLNEEVLGIYREKHDAYVRAAQAKRARGYQPEVLEETIQ